jgi:hypothetical protein
LGRDLFDVITVVLLLLFCFILLRSKALVKISCLHL